MNTLERLIDEEGYRKLISRDTILDIILRRDPSATDLDDGVPNKDYRLCNSLARLDGLLNQAGSERPIFVYTQPQDIHVSIINRDNRSVPDGERYPGFDAAYASRLRRLDQCFGRFIDRLKARGIYEQSVVILTSDHGDSLGEGGRYGHAYTLFPEVVRIPLIIHLPAGMQKLRRDENQAAFLSDVTPSLYYLLGRPTVRHEVLGRPLFTETIEEQAPYLRDRHLLASSYGPVWGVLRQNGRYLYIADGVNYKDYFFDLATDPAGERNLVNPEASREYRKMIEDGIAALNAFYRFRAGS
jgi:arylsulfatase A-like enzyme